MDSGIFLNKRNVSQLLVKVTFALVLAAVIGLIFKYGFGNARVFGLIHAFSFEQELSLPTLYNTSLLLVVSMLLVLIWHQLKNQRPRHVWIFLAAFIFFLAYDEYGFVHESIAKSLEGKYPEWMFIVPYMMVAFLLSAFFLPTFLKLPYRIQLVLIFGGSLWVLGAIDSLRIASESLGWEGEERGWYTGFRIICEELMEIIGLLFVIRALMDVLVTNGGIHIRIAGSSSSS